MPAGSRPLDRIVDPSAVSYVFFRIPTAFAMIIRFDSEILSPDAIKVEDNPPNHPDDGHEAINRAISRLKKCGCAVQLLPEDDKSLVAEIVTFELTGRIMARSV